MRKIFKLSLLLSFLIFSNCKKEVEKKVTKKSEKLILQKMHSIDIMSWSARTGKPDYEHIDYENDSIYYFYGILYGEYEVPEISDEGGLYIKGKEYVIKITPKTKDSIAKLYHLKKFEFKPKKKYQDHFEYEDCVLKRKIKMDSGAVHTLQDKNGAVYQIVNICHKPIWLQVCYKGKTYKERIQSGRNLIYGKLLGLGYERVMLYDIDKDGKNELLVFIDEGTRYYADVYKINLPK